MSLGWTASLESCGLSHFLPAFWTEFGPRGDRFSAVGTRRHGLCGRRYEHGGSAVGAESGSLLNTVSALGACDECCLGLRGWLHLGVHHLGYEDHSCSEARAWRRADA